MHEGVNIDFSRFNIIRRKIGVKVPKSGHTQDFSACNV